MMLSVRNLRFSYGSREVLHGLSFDADENSIVSILGPNGVGKTTLLRCICRLHAPASGTVEVDGRSLESMKMRELAHHIAYVPQRSRTSRATVFDSILIGRRPYIDWTVSDNDKRMVWDVIDRLGLRDLALKYVDQISGGEFQKVQIARAVVQTPKVLILDEPTNNLDISNQYRTMELIHDMARSEGLCTVMTMHDINLAAQFSDRLLFVRDGSVAAYGGPEIITEELVREVYGVDTDILDHNGLPVVVPRRHQ